MFIGWIDLTISAIDWIDLMISAVEDLLCWAASELSLVLTCWPCRSSCPAAAPGFRGHRRAKSTAAHRKDEVVASIYVDVAHVLAAVRLGVSFLSRAAVHAERLRFHFFVIATSSFTPVLVRDEESQTRFIKRAPQSRRGPVVCNQSDEGRSLKSAKCWLSVILVASA